MNSKKPLIEQGHQKSLAAHKSNRPAPNVESAIAIEMVAFIHARCPPITKGNVMICLSGSLDKQYVINGKEQS